VISARNSARDSDSNLLVPKGTNQLGGDLVGDDSDPFEDPFEVSTRCDASDDSGQERLETGAVRAGQVAKMHATVVQKVADVANKLQAGSRRIYRITPSSPPTSRSTVSF
jgi:hypothetical protein